MDINSLHVVHRLRLLLHMMLLLLHVLLLHVVLLLLHVGRRRHVLVVEIRHLGVLLLVILLMHR